jgi:RimJ/RimL family protein N-acetyltransferase
VGGEPLLETERLVLRHWRESDLEPFAELNADPVVMEHFVSTQTRTQSDTTAARIQGHFDEHGFGLFAVEVRGGLPFIGFVGLMVPQFDAPFVPCVEIGWRLALQAHGHGYATEAARAVLKFGFTEVGLAEILSFTTPANRASRNVMEKLGMSHDPADDFDHPGVPPGSPVRPHVVYRLARKGWESEVGP